MDRVEQDEKTTDLQVTKRKREPEMFLESEAPFEIKFQLAGEFTNKYEYFMQGRVNEIQATLQQIRDRFDRYMSKFPKRFIDEPPVSRLDSVHYTSD